MKIVLIHPRVIDTAHPPLGLLSIASVLKREGHQVKVFDPFPASSAEGTLIGEIVEFKPDILGLSLMTIQYRKAKELIQQLKNEIPNAVYCCGGAHASALPEETLHDLNIDFIVIGEGEYTTRDVCSALDTGYSLEDIPGVAYKEKGEIIFNESKPLIQNLDEIPFPDRGLLDFSWYLKPPGLIRGVSLNRCTTVITSRGCPHQCIYCRKMFGKKIRKRSVSNIIEEIETLVQNYGIDGIFFVDDLFTSNKAWVIELCREMRRRDIQLTFACQARVDTISEEMLWEMRKVGFKQIDFGLESGSERVLKALKKGTSVSQSREAFSLAKKVGVRRMACCMVGNPEEEIEDIKKTSDLLKEIRPDFVRFYYTTPFPGTELYQMAKKNKWIDPNLSFDEKWECRQADVPIMEINFNKKELRKILSRLQNQFFLMNYRSYLKNITLVKEIGICLLANPLKTLKLLMKFIKSRRVDDIVEGTLWIYKECANE